MRRGLTTTLAVLCLALLAPALAAAHHDASVTAAGPSLAAVPPEACPGAPMHPSQVITGELGAELQGGFVLVPFNVPAGTTAVRVKYCYDPAQGPFIRDVLDLGIYEPRRAGAREGSELWGEPEFRGWGGSSHPDVIISGEGFSTEAQFVANPRGNVPGKTTRGFLPGPIRAGEWAVELGVAAVLPTSIPGADGKVGWRVEVELSEDPGFADEPYSPAPYDSGPARPGAGWFTGDVHVHAEHSSLGDATMSETFGYAFRSPADGGAGLDFILLSDYVSGSAWGEIGRYQSRYPGRLIGRSAEIITYRGHTNNHASARYVDYRTGRVYVREADGSLAQARGPRPPSDIFGEVRAGGGFTQINHPAIFPSSVPAYVYFCRGCPWDYSSAETDYSQVDAIEVATGPPPPLNAFAAQALDFYERALDLGYKIAAVGSSDSHNAGRTPSTTSPQSPVGVASTVVYADELSERGIARGVKAGHTYVKIRGSSGPDIRFSATTWGKRPATGIMGDTLRGSGATFQARVLRGVSAPDPFGLGPPDLVVLKDGVEHSRARVTSDDFSITFPSAGIGRYELRLERLGLVDVLSSSIYLESLPRRPGKGCGDRNHLHDRSAECGKSVSG